MQKIPSLFFSGLMLFGAGQNCLAMHEQMASQETRPACVPACKRCLSDAFKITIGATACFASLCGIKYLHQIDNEDATSQTPFTKIIKDTDLTVELASSLLACAGFFGIYTIYQTSKLMHHSWDLAQLFAIDRSSKKVQ